MAALTVRATPVFSTRSVWRTARLRRNCSHRAFQKRARVIIFIGEAQPWLILQSHAASARISSRHERIIPLAPDPDNVVKAASIAHAGFPQQGHIRDQSGAHALVAKTVGQDPFVVAQRRPAQVGISEPIPAGPPASPGGQRGQVFGKVLIKHDPFGGQPVKVGRLDPGITIDTQKTQVKTVANDDDDIHGHDCIRSRLADKKNSLAGPRPARSPHPSQLALDRP